MKMLTDEALSALVQLPGVGHKTASCVLTYSGLKKEALPIDTHLNRVVRRLRLAKIPGKSLTKLNRERMITQIQKEIPDAGYAHLLFVMLGREYCSTRSPKCFDCPLGEICLSKGIRSQSK